MVNNKKPRIIKKRMAINHQYHIKTRYIVDDVFVFPTKKQAEEFIR